MKTTSTLEGQTILVIGGSSGIGFGVALASLNNLAAKVIIASSSQDKVKSAVERLKSQSAVKGGIVEGVVIDGKDLTGVEKAVKGLGKINHLVFTGGDSIDGVIGKNIRDVDFTDLTDKVFQVRFWAAVQAARAAKFASEGGSITFTSGVNSFKPGPGWALPAGVGMALDGITRGLAVDLAPSDIRVNCVSPGWINTEIFDSIPEDAKKAMLEKGAKQTLAGRVGKPEDTAEAYLFLMKCGFITGQTIKVDGGQLLTP